MLAPIIVDNMFRELEKIALAAEYGKLGRGGWGRIAKRPMARPVEALPERGEANNIVSLRRRSARLRGVQVKNP